MLEKGKQVMVLSAGALLPRPDLIELAKSNGVLCPPSGVDPEIHAPTPDAGNTPVIPPPGSPGGNQNLQPK